MWRQLSPVLATLLALTIAPAPSRGAELRLGGYGAAEHDLGAHDGTTSVEEWVYSVHCSDGTALFITYAYSSLWFLPDTAGVEVTVVAPGAEARTYGHRVGKAEVQSGSGDLAFGPRVRTSGLAPAAIHLHAESDWHDGVVVDVELAKPWPGFTVGDGLLALGPAASEPVRVGVITPRANATVRLTQGGAPRLLSGVAWGIHTYSPALPSKLAKRRQTVVAHLGNRAVVAVAYQARGSEEGATAGFLAAVGRTAGEGAAQPLARVAWPETLDQRGCLTPVRFLLEGAPSASGAPLRLAGKRSSTEHVFAITDPMRPLTRVAVAAVVGDPVFVRASSRVEWQGGGERLTGRAWHRVECADR